MVIIGEYLSGDAVSNSLVVKILVKLQSNMLLIETIFKRTVLSFCVFGFKCVKSLLIIIQRVFILEAAFPKYLVNVR